MKRPREGPASGATLIRSLIVIPTGGMIVAGAVYVVRGGPAPSQGQFDANFFELVAAALLPSLVYLLGVRTRRSSLIYGLLLLGVTALAWVPVFLVDDAMRGVLVLPAFFMTLTTSVLAGFDDRRDARGSQRA